MMKFLLMISALFISSAPVHACPLCHSQTGEAVYRGIVEGNIPLNLAAVALPLLLTTLTLGIILREDL